MKGFKVGDRRKGWRIPLAVCFNGHPTQIDSTATEMDLIVEEIEEVFAACGHWIWGDANFCVWCGAPVAQNNGN